MSGTNSVKNLAQASKEEQKRFLCSFDTVLFDMDGVIWLGYKALPGAQECIAKLKNLCKNVTFVTNNAITNTNNLHQILLKNNFIAEKTDIVNPTEAYINYLQKIKFDKTLYVVGAQILKDEFTKAGFKVTSDSGNPIIETVPALIEAVLTSDEEVGAVIVDFDINLTLLKLQKCLTYLKKPDCLFIVGMADKILPLPNSGTILGNYHFIECLKDHSGRIPYQMAKPSSNYNDFIIEKYNITDPKKVLFIGDSINDDMAFANNCGYQKLLVLTGITKKEDVLNWKHNNDLKPEYYVDSIGALNLILGMLKI